MNSITSITQCRVSPLFKKFSIHSRILFISSLLFVLNCSSYEKIPNEKRMIFTYEAKRVFKDCNKDKKDQWDKDYQQHKGNKQELAKLEPDPCPNKLEIQSEDDSSDKGKINISYKSSTLTFGADYKSINLKGSMKLGGKEYFYCLEPVGPIGILKDTSTSASIQNPAKLELTLKHDSKDSAVKIYNMTDALVVLQYLSFNYCQMYGAGVLNGEEYKLKLDNLQKDISCLLGVQPRCSQ